MRRRRVLVDVTMVKSFRSSYTGLHPPTPPARTTPALKAGPNSLFQALDAVVALAGFRRPVVQMMALERDDLLRAGGRMRDPRTASSSQDRERAREGLGGLGSGVWVWGLGFGVRGLG